MEGSRPMGGIWRVGHADRVPKGLAPDSYRSSALRLWRPRFCVAVLLQVYEVGALIFLCTSVFQTVT